MDSCYGSLSATGSHDANLKLDRDTSFSSEVLCTKPQESESCSGVRGRQIGGHGRRLRQWLADEAQSGFGSVRLQRFLRGLQADLWLAEGSGLISGGAS